MARYMRRQPQTDQHSQLRPPAVIGAGIYYRGILTREVAVRTRVEQPRHFGSTHLRPPTVVNQPGMEIYGPETSLARITPPPTISRLQPPTVVNAPLGAYPVAVTLAPSPTQARRAHNRLSPPIIPPLARPPLVHLAPSSRGRPLNHLFPPTVVFLAVELSGPEVTLAPSSRLGRQQHAHPSPPVVVFLAVEVYGPETSLTRIRPPRTEARILPPVIPPLAEPTRTSLVRITPPPTISRLSPPAVVAAPAVFYGPQVHTVRIKPPPTLSRLSPPTVVGLAIEIYGPVVRLARIVPPPTSSRLEPPAPGTEPVFLGPAVHLARNAPKPTITAIRPPVIPPLAEPTRVHLAYSRRGKPLSRLEPPAVIKVEQFFGPATSLVRNKPKPTTALLQPPAVVQAATLVFYGPATSLAYSRRGRPLPDLKPPAVVGAGRFFRGLLVSLAQAPTPQRFARTDLRPPIVVRTAVELFGPRVELAPSRFPRPESSLRPPVVVGQPPFRGLLLSLAPQAVRPGRARLEPPAVVAYPPFAPITAHLAYSLRGKPRSFLEPPSVVRPPEPHAEPIRVTLAYQSRRPGYWFLKPPTVAFIPTPGDVCGFDITTFFVCGDDLPVDQAVYGVTTATGDTISGGDTPNTDLVWGYDFTDAQVTGEDA